MNLANHRVVDLLPDRSATSVAAWLAQHPTINVVCRDRSDLYADGIRRGAPQAVQVVDRFHLVHNLRQVLEAFLLDHRPALQAAAVGTALARTPFPRVASVPPRYQGRRRSAKPTPPPERSPSARVLTPYMPYLIRRWRESGADSRRLWLEIQALGYTHFARTVGRFITRLRRAADAGHALEAQCSPAISLQLSPEAGGSAWAAPWGHTSRRLPCGSLGVTFLPPAWPSRHA